MRNNIWFIGACVLFFIAGYTMNDVAISLPRYKVAIVDITKIMELSPEVQNLRISQEKQTKELDNLISKAQNELANEKDQNKFLQLETSYKKQIEDKKLAIENEYNKKIVQITSIIKSTISQQAKKTDYNLVLPAGMVISGGEDITENVIKNMNTKNEK